MFSNHRLGGRAGNAGSSLVDSSDSELILTALYQAVDLALDLVTHGLHLLDGENLALHPLAHVLLLLLDDVVSDGSPPVGLGRGPGKVGVVGTPVENVWLTAGSGLV